MHWKNENGLKSNLLQTNQEVMETSDNLGAMLKAI